LEAANIPSRGAAVDTHLLLEEVLTVFLVELLLYPPPQNIIWVILKAEEEEFLIFGLIILSR